MREIEQAGLLSSFHDFYLKFVAGLQKVLLDALPDRLNQLRSTANSMKTA